MTLLGGLPARALMRRGKAVQVDPITPTLKAPGTKRLKLKYHELLSNFAFKFNLRRYSEVCVSVTGGAVDATQICCGGQTRIWTFLELIHTLKVVEPGA